MSRNAFAQIERETNEAEGLREHARMERMEMTNRELLELAAKAVGIDGRYVHDDEWYGTGIVFTNENDCNQEWNPLTDDGDAMRLAVKLKMEVCVWHSDTTIQTDEVETITLDHEGDPYAATRRAIVRAAAEIGKGMK